MKLIYAAGLLYILACLAALTSRLDMFAPKPPVIPKESINASTWFSRMRPYCNPVEVLAHMQETPPPDTAEGNSYAAACYALSGKIQEARLMMDALPSAQRAKAAETVFQVFYTVVEKGDTSTAGPAMELVLEYLPDHYMALYYAGVAEAISGQYDLSRKHLTRFLEVYKPNDQWKQSGESFLNRLPVQQ